MINFPDLAIRVHAAKDDDPLAITLSTFDPDNDDEGRARDYGSEVITGEIVGDGSRDGYDTTKIRQLLSLLEHAPDLFHLLRQMNGALVDPHPRLTQLSERAERLIRAIEAGELKYADRF